MRVVGRLRDVAAREKKVNALDLGCGAGHLRAALEADAIDGDVAGGIMTLAQCDAAPEAVAACASRAPATGFATTAVVADEERPLPFDDASFDAVLSSGSLHWVNDLPGALREVRRVLRPDGVFIGALAGAGTLGELQYCRHPAWGRGIERGQPRRGRRRARRPRGGRGGANGRRRAAVLARRAPRGLRPAPPPGRLRAHHGRRRARAGRLRRRLSAARRPPAHGRAARTAGTGTARSRGTPRGGRRVPAHVSGGQRRDRAPRVVRDDVPHRLGARRESAGASGCSTSRLRRPLSSLRPTPSISLPSESSMGNSTRIFGSMHSKLAGVCALGSLGPGRKALSAVMWTLVSV